MATNSINILMNMLSVWLPDSDSLPCVGADITHLWRRGVAPSQYPRANWKPLVYTPLNAALDEIRLFKIQAVRDGIVHGLMETFELNKAPPFQALSYMWGHVGPVRELKTQDGSLAIRMNLFRFLRSYASFEPEKFQQIFPRMAPSYNGPLDAYLWIDQICINQQNINERNTQVELMSDIFPRAMEVIAWPSNSAREMALMEKALLGLMSMPGVSPTPASDLEASRRTRPPDLKRAEAVLCLAEYWRRVWVQQEIIKAREVHVLSGTAAALFRDVKIINSSPLEEGWSHAFGQLCAARRDASAYRWYPPSLANTVGHFEGCSCSDQRDHVYALMSLVDPMQRMPIDYSLSTHQLFWLLVRDLILNHMSLDDAEEMRLRGLNLLLYSSTARNLGIGDELYREHIREFFTGFWIAVRKCPGLDLDAYEAKTPKPWLKRERWKSSRFWRSKLLWYDIRQRVLDIHPWIRSTHGTAPADGMAFDGRNNVLSATSMCAILISALGLLVRVDLGESWKFDTVRLLLFLVLAAYVICMTWGMAGDHLQNGYPADVAMQRPWTAGKERRLLFLVAGASAVIFIRRSTSTTGVNNMVDEVLETAPPLILIWFIIFVRVYMIPLERWTSGTVRHSCFTLDAMTVADNQQSIWMKKRSVALWVAAGHATVWRFEASTCAIVLNLIASKRPNYIATFAMRHLTPLLRQFSPPSSSQPPQPSPSHPPQSTPPHPPQHSTAPQTRPLPSFSAPPHSPSANQAQTVLPQDAP